MHDGPAMLTLRAQDSYVLEYPHKDLNCGPWNQKPVCYQLATLTPWATLTPRAVLNY